MKHTYVTREIIDNKDRVECDACSEEFKEGDERSGGFLFGSNAYCPDCAKNSLPRIRGYDEERFIKAWCPPNMSFRRWVLDVLRKDNNMTTITTIEVKDEAP